MSKIGQIADAYYKTNNTPIKIDILGNVSNHKEMLMAIRREVSRLSEFEQKRIEPYPGCVIYIQRLPNQLAEYRGWNYVSDRVGWISIMDYDFIKKAIQEKAKKLPKYSKNIADVRLLLVSNRIFNFGKSTIRDSNAFDACGFTNVYYLSYPEEIFKF